MMPRNILSPARPTPADTAMPPVAAAEFDLDADRDVTTLVHADYDLHPLAVRSLDHYMEKGEEGERFHVR